MARVLVVDDEPDVRALIQVVLEADGHEVAVAANGTEALQVVTVAASRPDVIVLDVMMPGLDGWAVLERMKGTGSPVRDVPVILLTARGEPEDRIRGGIEGAIRYLVKPFENDVLQAEVRRALEGEPEPTRRRRVRHESLEELARLEKGGPVDGAPAPPSGAPRPHLTRLEHAREGPVAAPQARAAREVLDQLSPKQRELLETLARAPSVSDAATQLSVSRSNVYASLRRISRKLGTRSVPELLSLVRQGEFLGREPPR